MAWVGGPADRKLNRKTEFPACLRPRPVPRCRGGGPRYHHQKISEATYRNADLKQLEYHRSWHILAYALSPPPGLASKGGFFPRVVRPADGYIYHDHDAPVKTAFSDCPHPSQSSPSSTRSPCLSGLMFLATAVLLSFLSVPRVCAQSEMAQCHPGYEWVCVQSDSPDASQGSVTAQRSGCLLSCSYRIRILWAKIPARLVLYWMHRVVVLVGRLVMDIFPIVSEDCLFIASDVQLSAG